MSWVTMTEITKQFGNVVACNDVTISFRPGEVHALLGENGAGKSTLMKILSGLIKPDRGTIIIDQKRVVFHHPQDALTAGIGMVHQHFMLVPALSVWENFIVGYKKAGMIPDTAVLVREIKGLSEQYGLQVHPETIVTHLTVGEQQRVEILRLLHRQAKVFIFDEPTSVLTPQEGETLGRVLRTLVEEQKTVILISHKMTEVRQYADQVSVLRRGKIVLSDQIKQVSDEALTKAMIASTIPTNGNGHGEKKPQAKTPVLEVSHVIIRDHRGLRAVEDVNFSVLSGQIFGVAGIAGNGQRPLAEAIAGLERIASGKIRFRGREIQALAPNQIRALGIRYIPEDRMLIGTVPSMPVFLNATLGNWENGAFSRGPWLSGNRMASFARKLIANYHIKAHAEQRIDELSGGNVQKLIVGREVDTHQHLIIAASPTHGLDIGARDAIHSTLKDAANSGTAILLFSEDLDELFALCDRVAVIHRGHIIGIVEPETADLPAVGKMMMGLS